MLGQTGENSVGDGRMTDMSDETGEEKTVTERIAV